MSELRSDQIERLALMLEYTNQRGGETPYGEEEMVALGVERGWIEITGPSDVPSVPRIRLTDAGRALLLKAHGKIWPAWSFALLSGAIILPLAIVLAWMDPPWWVKAIYLTAIMLWAVIWVVAAFRGRVQ